MNISNTTSACWNNWFYFVILCSCVPKSQCEGGGLLDVRGTGGYTCEDTSQICCHQSLLNKQESQDEIILEDQKETSEGFDYYDEDVPCSTIASEGYRYSDDPLKRNKFSFILYLISH